MTREKIVVITRKTALQELVARYGTRDQARFYLEHLGEDFGAVERAHETFERARELLARSLPDGVRTQWLERELLPTYTFGASDLVVTLGPDGLVVNAAKYLKGQPLVAFNPDAERVDGVLVPFPVEWAISIVRAALEDKLRVQKVAMAQAQTEDGQRILAVNDLFLGANSHVAARYRLKFGQREETQISSGLIVSTGAGSTGWRRSILTTAHRICGAEIEEDDYRFPLESRRISFLVREGFESRTSDAELVRGDLGESDFLEVTSQMPQGGVIFSDGVESDFLEWSSGLTARVSLASETLNLVAPEVKR